MAAPALGQEASPSRLPEIFSGRENDLLAAWLVAQLSATTLRSDLLPESALREESTRFVRTLRAALARGVPEDVGSHAFDEVHAVLEEISAARARLGFSPSETATFIFSLKEPLFTELRRAHGNNAAALADDLWRTSAFLDKFGLFTTEVHQRAQASIIDRQRAEMLELSTPVVTLWDGILALPLIGTLDSIRTQAVMENLLQRIVSDEARIAIIDITGVPTVDTLTAQHLLKTVTATRLMGAECIISGIRPQIAQTIVHLGVDLGDVVTKSSLAGALAVALTRLGRQITDLRPKA